MANNPLIAADTAVSKRLLLHADDLGMNQPVTDGILRGFRHGLLTSTSLLANAPAAAEALRVWPQLQEQQAAGVLPSAESRERLGDTGSPFDLGIHLNLTQGYPLTGSRYPDELREGDGHFCGISRAFVRLRRRRHRFVASITAELSQQIEFLLDHGQQPTHLNGHQYVELLPGLSQIIPRLLANYRIPVVRVAREPARFPESIIAARELSNWGLGRIKWLFALAFRQRMIRLGVPHPRACFGTCHAGRVGLSAMRRFLDGGQMPAVVELVMHPGSLAEVRDVPAETAGDTWHDPLAIGRTRELDLLQSEELIDLFESRGWQLGRLSELVDFSQRTVNTGDRIQNETAA
ncbi:MAG: ChbG/HpnK family deacetylase [Rhodopirellula sp.]|nr:ChbG/HpnK family deacetylase [Rhodopirellula sp.]